MLGVHPRQPQQSLWSNSGFPARTSTFHTQVDPKAGHSKKCKQHNVVQSCATVSLKGSAKDQVLK